MIKLYFRQQAQLFYGYLPDGFCLLPYQMPYSCSPNERVVSENFSHEKK